MYTTLNLFTAGFANRHFHFFIANACKLPRPALSNLQLTGNEKVEILANDIILIGYPAPDNYYDFKTKPIIKIDGQILDYEYPVDTNDNAVVEDTLVSISMTIKVRVSPIESKVLDVRLYSNPDIIRDNPDGSKTYVNNPDSSVDWIDIGDVRYHNIKSTANIRQDGIEGYIKALN